MRIPTPSIKINNFNRKGVSGPAIGNTLGDQVVGVGVLTLNYNFTTSSGAKVLVIGFKNDGPDPTTVTYNGVAMTKFSTLNNVTFGINLSLWYLISPPIGTFAVNAVVGSNGGSFHAFCTADYQGINTVGNPEGVGGTLNATSANPSVSVTTATNNELLVMFGLCGGGTPTAGANTRVAISGGYGLYDNIGFLQNAGTLSLNLVVASGSNSLMAMALKQ